GNDLKEGILQMSLAALSRRPNFGRSGRAIPLESNHFEIRLSGKQMVVQQYYVQITDPFRDKIDRYFCFYFLRREGRRFTIRFVALLLCAAFLDGKIARDRRSGVRPGTVKPGYKSSVGKSKSVSYIRGALICGIGSCVVA